MKTIHYKPIIGTPFRIETSVVQNKPGTWNSTKVSIYRDNNFDIKSNVYRKGILIGEYIRNYSNYGFETFHPFQIENQWYALYSANYTATRVVKLHEDRIEDWCGEDPAANGFCPTEFYIPKYVKSKYKSEIDSELYSIFYVDSDYTNDEMQVEINSPEFEAIDYCNFGFMSGCVWGDDSSWKLKYIDLSWIPDKILIVDNKFGYWELPAGPLKSHIRMDDWEPDHRWIRIAKEESFNLVK